MREINNLAKLLWLFTLLAAGLSLTIILSPQSTKWSFAVESLNVGVYWDSECTQNVTSIEWGELAPGSVYDVDLFVRNEDSDLPCFLLLWAEDWNPPEAGYYISIGWDYDDNPIDPGAVASVTFSLKVTRIIRGITDFSFDLIVLGMDQLKGDVNHDGVIDVTDIILVCSASGSTPSDSNWNPDADLNSDWKIDITDLIIVINRYGPHS